MIVNPALSSQLWKRGKGRGDEGEDRKKKGKGGSTRLFPVREPNSSTASKYEPASQILEKGKLLYRWNVDIFHIIKTYHWERLDYKGIHSICNCLSRIPKKLFSFPLLYKLLFQYDSCTKARSTRPCISTVWNYFIPSFPQQCQKYWIKIWRRKQLRGVHITYLICSPGNCSHILSTRKLQELSLTEHIYVALTYSPWGSGFMREKPGNEQLP